MANEFLPFSPTDTGSNLMSQADYLASTERLEGHKPGLANLELENKALRQANAIASQIAEFMSQKLAVDILDDGISANLLAQIVSSFDRKRVVSKAASYALNAMTDEVIVFTAVGTATLPTAVGISGKIFCIMNSTGGYGVTIATTSSQTVGGRASGAIVLSQSGNFVTVISNGTNWNIIGQSIASTVGSSWTFTSNGNFTAPVNSSTSTAYRCRIQGGGGGGGGANGTNAAGGGGGAGAYAESVFSGITPGTVIAVTVGAFGAGGTNAGGNGGTGGASSIAAPISISCGGGLGGVGHTTSGALGGAGGTVTGSPTIIGKSGSYGRNSSISASPAAGVSGDGGGTPFGSGGRGGAHAVIGPGAGDTSWGCGGGGGLGATAVGGNGMGGIVIIEQLTP